MKFLNMNESAVSPIVATLVLIVVAVVGAVAVGTIMGTFSNDVSEQTNVGDVGAASASEILIAGSTTVQPVSELLGEAYMKEKPGVKVTVQGGGSGAGIASAGMGIVDIGAASKHLPDADAAKYPDLNEYVIGGSAVVVIVNENAAVSDDNVTEAELLALYESGTAFDNIDTAYHRAEASGTEDTFSKWLTGSDGGIDGYTGTHLKTATGNAGILAAIQGNTDGDAIGFVDAGYAFGADDITVLAIGLQEATDDNILDALKGENTYPSGLTRPLVYLANGNPSSVVKDFINFAQSPGSIEQFHAAGMYSIVEFA
ncbi:substrate-binding domain-containing protein [Methanoculleus sp.]|nr:substrate-binding domain-containing protein [Methanoculleus sp.]